MRFHVSDTLETVLNAVIRRRQLRQHEGYTYHIQRWVDPDEQQSKISPPSSTAKDASEANATSSLRKPLDLNLTLRDWQNQNLPLRFVLIREHCKHQSPTLVLFHIDYELYSRCGYDTITVILWRCGVLAVEHSLDTGGVMVRFRPVVILSRPINVLCILDANPRECDDACI